MRLSKLTGFLSGLAVSVMVSATELLPVVTAAEASQSGSHHHLDRQRNVNEFATAQRHGDSQLEPKQTKGTVAVSSTITTATELVAQREKLSENPLCRLISEPAVITDAVAEMKTQTPAPSKLSHFVSSLVQRFLQVVGLDNVLVQEEPVQPQPVAIVSRPVIEQAPNFNADQSGGAKFVSDRPTESRPTLGQDYELWVQGELIASIRSQEQANLLAQRLERLLEASSFNAAAITPKLHDNRPAIAMGDQILFVIDKSITREDIKNHEILAIRWANNLRIAFKVPPLDLITAQANMYQVEETSESFEGLASWYGPYFHGRLTANGEIYDQFAFTAAHPSMTLDTFLKITNLDNQKSVIIRLNDRGPYIPPRTLDLSLGAAHCLGSVETGVIPYKATIMKRQPTLATEAI